jgi:hypothetical protein
MPDKLTASMMTAGSPTPPGVCGLPVLILRIEYFPKADKPCGTPSWLQPGAHFLIGL